MNQPTGAAPNTATDPNTAFAPSTATNPKDTAISNTAAPPQDAAPEDGLRVVIADDSLLIHTGVMSPIAQVPCRRSRE